MDSNIIAALIGSFGGFLTAIFVFYISRFYTDYDQSQLQKKIRENSVYRERSLEQQIDKEFIFSLPRLKQEVYSNCHTNWDTDITLNMIKGNDDLIWFLRFCWLSLARFFPETHFSNAGHNFYIDQYILERTDYHYSKLDVADIERSGNISRVQLGYAVASDLDALIADLVGQILNFENIRKEDWFSDWKIISE